MPRPCLCDNARPGPYRPGDCLDCWKWHNSPDWRARWEGTPAPRRSRPVAGPPRPPCEFVDETTVLEVRREGCPRCAVHPCEVFGRATRAHRFPDLACCDGCPAHVERGVPAPTLLVLQNHLAPGDAVVLSAAVESLHRAHPGKYLTAVDSTAQDLWEHHPRVVPPDAVPALAALLREEPRVVEAEYPAVNQSDDRALHFMQAYCEHLESALGVRVPLAVNRPHLHLSEEEKGWMNQVQELTGDPAPYWVVNAGHKPDFTAKWWGAHNYQAVTDLLGGLVRFVQVGEAHHAHPPLSGVLDLRGLTDVRQLMRLVYHAQGGLGPSTFLQHLCAAFEKPYVLLAGGREPRSWQEYPRQTMFSAVGTRPCCRGRSCWRSRTVALGDGAEEDASLCVEPAESPSGPIPACLAAVRPEAVADAVLAYAESS